MNYEVKWAAAAQARGHTYLGPSDRHGNAWYTLDCGHKKEAAYGHMARGVVACQTCIDARYAADAQAWGCTDLGSVKKGYRRYRLPCGHEKAYRPGNMRAYGPGGCQPCKDEKRVADAQVWGCIYLGPAKKEGYGRYRLPCEHEKVKRLGCMHALGPQGCETCKEEQYAAEAQAWGCTDLGVVKNKDCRRYGLPCEHEKVMHSSYMRDRGPGGCQTCQDARYAAEAQAWGCTDLGSVKKGYRRYRLPCEHEKVKTISDMRDHGPQGCKTCKDARYAAEAQAWGCTDLGAVKGRGCTDLRLSKKIGGFRRYRVPTCEHEKVMQSKHMRDHGPRGCKTCQDARYAAEAQAWGCTDLGSAPDEGKGFRRYRLPCEHEKVVQIWFMREHGTGGCQTCQDAKWAAEAQAWGCTDLGPVKQGYRRYRLPCEHEKAMQSAVMRYRGPQGCRTCKETARTRPSNMYLLLIIEGCREWLKLGYAENVDVRTKDYGLPAGSEVASVHTLSFNTGAAARKAEGGIHRKFFKQRMRPETMKDYHSNGYTECYPLKMKDQLIEAMNCALTE